VLLSLGRLLAIFLASLLRLFARFSLAVGVAEEVLGKERGVEGDVRSQSETYSFQGIEEPVDICTCTGLSILTDGFSKE
jgi:hypothetical protein